MRLILVRENQKHDSEGVCLVPIPKSEFALVGGQEHDTFEVTGEWLFNITQYPLVPFEDRVACYTASEAEIGTYQAVGMYPVWEPPHPELLTNFPTSDNTEKYPWRTISPRIFSSGSMMGTFFRQECETTAGWALMYAKHHGYWRRFTVDEVEDFMAETGGWDRNNVSFGFNGLDGGFIPGKRQFGGGTSAGIASGVMFEKGDDDRYSYTDAFITRCLKKVRRAKPDGLHLPEYHVAEEHRNAA